MFLNLFKKSKEEKKEIIEENKYTFTGYEQVYQAVEKMNERYYEHNIKAVSILLKGDREEIISKAKDDLIKGVEYMTEEDGFVTFVFNSGVKLRVECNKYIVNNFNIYNTEKEYLNFTKHRDGLFHYISIPQNENTYIFYLFRKGYIYYGDLYINDAYNLSYVKGFMEDLAKKKYEEIRHLIEERSRRTKEMLLDKIDNKQNVTLDFLKTFRDGIELETIHKELEAKASRIEEIKNTI